MTALARLLIGPAIGLTLILDRLAYRRGLRAIKTYEAPTVLPTPSAERETRPLAAVGLGVAAGSPTETPAAVPPAPSSPPPDGGAGSTPPARPRPQRGRHAHPTRVLWGPWAKPVLEMTP